MPHLTFRVDIPCHEVACNSKADIVETLRAVANKIEAKTEEGAFARFKLDDMTVDDLSYVSYGTVLHNT